MSEPQPLEPVSALTTMAQSMERMALMMRQAMVALNGVDTKVNGHLAEFEARITETVAKPIQERMGVIEAKQRDMILVTPAEQEELREAVSAKAKEFGGGRIHFARMYGRLHREFGIPKYNYLRQVDFSQALKYINAYDGARTTWTVKQ